MERRNPLRLRLSWIMASPDGSGSPDRLFILVVVVLAALLLPVGSPGQHRGLFSLVEPRRAPAGLAALQSRNFVRERLVGIDFSMLAAARAASVRGAEPQLTLRLNLFQDAEFNAVVESTHRTSSGYALVGRLLQDGLATMALVVNGEVVAGTVRTTEATYRIRTVGDGVYTIAQLDPSKHRSGAEPVIRPPPTPKTGPVRK